MTNILKELKKNKYVYLMAVPILLFYIIFHYLPMYGVIIAFKDFSPRAGILGSEWVGFDNFIEFFSNTYFLRVLTNTFVISIYSIVFGFSLPIILALSLNEVKAQHFKRTIQTITYLPHFISLVVICGLIIDFTSRNGVVNDIIALLGGERTTLLGRPELFRPIYIISEVWQHIGWDSIIYIAAISAIDPGLYEAATIDGAGRFKKILHVTIPGIMPTITILLILKIGKLMGVGYEKIILLYNSLTYETADVISTYVYRKGLIEFNFEFSAAVGLFNSVINFALLISANFISKRVSENSLW